MRTPGFSATQSLDATRQEGRDHTRRALLEPERALVPAQIDLVSRLSSKGGPLWLWEERPTCPLGQKAVWVNRGPREKCCDTVRRVWDKVLNRYVYQPVHVCDWQQCGGFEPAVRGWECQDVQFRVVA